MSHELERWAIDQLTVLGWDGEGNCASRVCNDLRFSLVVEPIIVHSPRGTFFRCEVGMRSFRHQFLVEWATTGATPICSLAHRMGARWYPYFFAGGDFKLALKRGVSFTYRLSGNRASRENTLREGLGEILSNVDSLEAFADDERIGMLSSRDHMGPYEVGVATCAALLGDSRKVVEGLKTTPSGWYAPGDILIIQNRLLAAIGEGKTEAIRGWSCQEDAWQYKGKV